MQNTSFVIYSPSYIIRKGLAAIIEKIYSNNTIQQIENTSEFFELIQKNETDFILLDINCPQIQKSITKLKTVSETNRIVAFYFQHKPKFDIHFIESIDINYPQNKVFKKLNKIFGKINAPDDGQNIPDEISKREADILRYIALGYSNKEIADKLFLSTHTVVTHRKNITRKLGIKTVSGLTIYAILNKLIDINDTPQI
ncbi:MAG: response regulator transcription factor [Bacteroidales bacterium]|nr:response regulator transcription factor [Bacteroidales bacterium]